MSDLPLSDQACERIAAYMRIALDDLNENCPASSRIAQLQEDLADWTQMLLEDRLARGWRPYPEIEPGEAQQASVALASGETFPDVYAAGAWRTQKDADVVAWMPLPAKD